MIGRHRSEFMRNFRSDEVDARLRQRFKVLFRCGSVLDDSGKEIVSAWVPQAHEVLRALLRESGPTPHAKAPVKRADPHSDAPIISCQVLVVLMSSFNAACYSRKATRATCNLGLSQVSPDHTFCTYT
jgi:hypothetical protein